MKKLELDVLKIIRRNSRTSLSKIAEELNIDARKIYEVMKALENRVICNYPTLIDFEKVGYPIMINYILIPRSDLDEKILSGFLSNHKSINNLSKTEKGFIAELVFKDMKELSEFNESIEKFNLREKKFHPVIKEIKREGFLL